MPPNTQNPLVIAAYVVGVLLSLPALAALVKLIVFVTRATSKLDDVAENQRDLKRQFSDYRHEKNTQAQAIELSLTLIESDVNALQEHNELAVRRYPDRRTGPVDRRHSA